MKRRGFFDYNLRFVETPTPTIDQRGCDSFMCSYYCIDAVTGELIYNSMMGD